MPSILELIEYSPIRLPKDDLSREVAELIWRNHKDQIEIQPPSFQTDNQWELKSLGYVGYIPVTNDLVLALRPKVPLKNIFGMLEYAYRLNPKLFEGLVNCATLEEFYERLASVMTKRILDRQRIGLYRKYLGFDERCSFVRGRLNISDRIRRPWNVFGECHFEEHTPEIEENAILGWTLGMVVRNAACSERVRPSIGRAYRAMGPANTAIPFSGRSCVGRIYNRLNADYEILHALCRFFLEKSGPDYDTAQHFMLPFLIDMDKLFEQFVAEWLRSHLPPTHSLQVQSRFALSQKYELKFVIDLVVSDASSGKPVCVIDTKYKAHETPVAADVAQVVAYAEALGCRDAVMVYPVSLDQSIDLPVGRIRVRSLHFPLDDDLETAGERFLQRLLLTG